MKKTFLLLLALFAIEAAVLPAEAFAGGKKKKTSAKSAKIQPDKSEPNNSKETAYDISSFLGSQTGSVTGGTAAKWFGVKYNSGISGKKDIDWYKIALDRNKIYTVSMNVFNGKMLTGELDNNWDHYLLFAEYAGGTMLNDSLTSSPDSPPAENTLRDIDTLYIKVMPNGKTIGKYSLELNIASCDKIAPDKYESNDSLASAFGIAVGKKDKSLDIDANFDYTTDKDFYKITLPGKKNYKVTLTCTENKDYPFVIHCGSEIDPQLGLIPIGELNPGKAPIADGDKNIFNFEGGSVPFYISCFPDNVNAPFPYNLHLAIEQIKKK